MRRIISVTKSQQEQLKSIFNCGERMLRKALTFDSDSELARKIRYTALSVWGCHIYTTVDEMECWHDADGRMHMYYPNGAYIVVDKKQNEARAYDVKGRVLITRVRDKNKANTNEPGRHILSGDQIEVA